MQARASQTANNWSHALVRRRFLNVLLSRNLIKSGYEYADVVRALKASDTLGDPRLPGFRPPTSNTPVKPGPSGSRPPASDVVDLSDSTDFSDF